MNFFVPSLSARRAWIEMLASRLTDMSAAVALRKESVDRNSGTWTLKQIPLTSLSARRAWIEIPDARSRICGTFVALRKESVDRNKMSKIAGMYEVGNVALRKESVDRNRGGDTHANRYYVSLSARRAWIEMVTVSLYPSCASVALRKESVDRNMGASYGRTAKMGRSPQGERG